MRILLGMPFGEAESSDALLGAETLGLRNWMKEGKKGKSLLAESC
jgi:hypothetical protein